MTTLTPLPGSDRGYELHGERATPAAPCSKCSSRSLPGRTVCAFHDEDPIEGERFDAPLPPSVCAWCGLILREGVGPISHGICPACVARIGEAA
jgi:hypothetical protein